ncbi:sulfatase-like hydrolase/transferase [Conexibacter sp. W3-3-2]|uniref:sulfatase-like hydrolase/transferase n=1 Tax=Conexibacter sp. W3-3-2 TaxID=2675227 RepID=UPI0028164D26|nr:sulfatase-like hydrolase/transferase [Conexibacter sp. W3-3-2]
MARPARSPSPDAGGSPSTATPACSPPSRSRRVPADVPHHPPGGLGAAGAAALTAAALGQASAGAQTPTRKPNILIVMCDQERAPQWTPDLPLPARDWIDSHGVTFERFHHSAVQCSSARACMWTGMYVPQNGIFGNFLQSWQFSLDPRIPTIADLLKEQGYTTAFFGKWHLSMVGTSLPEGPLDTLRNNYLAPYGFDYSEISTSLEPAGYNDGIYNDPVWTKQGVDWLKEHGGGDQPWFCVVSLLNPHDIAYFPRGFTADVTRPDWEVQLPPNFEDDVRSKPRVHAQYDGGAALVRGKVKPDDTATWKRLINTYCDLIVNTDDNYAAIMKALHHSGGFDDTVVIRTADHGEMAGSHRAVGKGPMIYDEQLRMPLSISYPKRFPAVQGARTPALAEAVDLVPTCLELAGVADPVNRYPWLRGRSLVPALQDPVGARGKEFTVSTCDEVWSPQDFAGQGKAWRRHVRAALSGRFKIARYVAMTGKPQTERTEDQEYELYDLREDPLELRNLARDPAYTPLLDELLTVLNDLERERLGPVEVPLSGPPSLIEPIRPDPIGRPSIGDQTKENPPSPVEGVPGAYVQLPFGDPHLLARVYDGVGGDRLPQTADESRALAEARALHRARMLCELGPMAGRTR